MTSLTQKDVCVGDSNIKEEVEDILVEFSRFATAPVVSSQLITTVDASHVLVVEKKGVRTSDGSTRAVLFLPQDSPDIC